MQSTRCGVADFQQATAYSYDGLQNSMFRFTAPGDASGKLQSTDPPSSRVTVNPARGSPAEVTGRTTTLTVASVEVVVAAPAAAL
jgi:hypothetical protein